MKAESLTQAATLTHGIVSGEDSSLSTAGRCAVQGAVVIIGVVAVVLVRVAVVVGLV